MGFKKSENIEEACILFWVSVPVLSVHIIFVQPNVSTAGSFFTIVCFFTILLTPIVNITVTIVDSPSGIDATAKATAVMKLLLIELPVKYFNKNTDKHMIKQTIPIILPIWFNFI